MTAPPDFMKTYPSRFLFACIALLFLGAALKAEDNKVIADLHLRLNWIKPGEFDMGTKSSGVMDQQPVTHVILTEGFWLGITEVTQAQWTAIMEKNPSNHQGDNLPVEGVGWDDAIKFCMKLTQRERAAGRLPEGFVYTLPTEAQWEYACRAGRTGYDVGMVNRVYDDFTEINAMAWTRENSGGATHPVGRKKPNAWGLYDMQGNVTEWCLSSWRHDYPGGTVTDPYHPMPKGEALVFYRGGAFGVEPGACTSTFRWWQFYYGYSPTSGFRLALCRARPDWTW